jgi:hypothetical protein
LLSSRSIVSMGNKGQVGYPSDVSDEEWAFVAPYLALCREDAAQRSHSLLLRTGVPRRRGAVVGLVRMV